MRLISFINDKRADWLLALMDRTETKIQYDTDKEGTLERICYTNYDYEKNGLLSVTITRPDSDTEFYDFTVQIETGYCNIQCPLKHIQPILCEDDIETDGDYTDLGLSVLTQESTIFCSVTFPIKKGAGRECKRIVQAYYPV